MSEIDYADLSRSLDIPYSFERQPTPVPATLRPDRRVPLTLLLVAKSHGAGAGWQGLQLLNWAVRDPKHTELLIALRGQRDIPDRPVVRFEPALDRALDLATGLKFLEQKGSRVFRLTDAGRSVVAEIEGSGAFARERATLGLLRGKITQAEVRQLLHWRDV